jgi:hypothetical protein
MDQGKPRLDLFDPEFIEGVSRVLTFGAEKYSPHNWRHGFDYSRLYAALQRHLNAYWSGQDVDPETGESHLYHAGCMLMFLAWMGNHRKDLDDRWSSLPPVASSSSSSPSGESGPTTGSWKPRGTA